MSSGQKFRLVMQKGTQPGASFELADSIIGIGRYSGNQISVSDEQVSRHHARLTRTAQGYSIEDLGSANGLFVNNARVTSLRALKPGDHVRLGLDIVFVYEVFHEDILAPAFDGVVPLEVGKIVSDKGATAYVKMDNEPTHRVSVVSPTPRGLPWGWIAACAVAIAIVIVLIIVLTTH